MAEKLRDKMLEEKDEVQKNQFLTFLLDNDYYGIEISNVIEIIGVQSITQMPDLPNYIKGIINLRGKIIPVMDVRLRFKKTELQYTDRTCIIVVDVKDILIGLIVDSVSEVLYINDTDIAQPPEIAKTYNKFIMGIGKIGNEVKLLLDCGKILSDDEIGVLVNI